MNASFVDIEALIFEGAKFVGLTIDHRHHIYIRQPLWGTSATLFLVQNPLL